MPRFSYFFYLHIPHEDVIWIVWAWWLGRQCADGIHRHSGDLQIFGFSSNSCSGLWPLLEMTSNVLCRKLWLVLFCPYQSCLCWVFLAGCTSLALVQASSLGLCCICHALFSWSPQPSWLYLSPFHSGLQAFLQCSVHPIPAALAHCSPPHIGRYFGVLWKQKSKL